MAAELSWTVVGTVLGAAVILLGLITVAQNWDLKKLLGIVQDRCAADPSLTNRKARMALAQGIAV